MLKFSVAAYEKRRWGGMIGEFFQNLNFGKLWRITRIADCGAGLIFGSSNSPAPFL
jgi:hypothetical protein